MKLQRTVQCSKCPWRVSVDPNTIPNGYDAEKHSKLIKTIATEDSPIFPDSMHVMSCHESHSDYCLGWLMNQLGPGNNIALRIVMLKCENLREVKLIGPQHETFTDTLSRQSRREQHKTKHEH